MKAAHRKAELCCSACLLLMLHEKGKLYNMCVKPQLCSIFYGKAQVLSKIRLEMLFDTYDCQTREERLRFHINSSWQAPDISAFHSLQKFQESRQTRGEKYFIHPMNSEFGDTRY